MSDVNAMKCERNEKFIFASIKTFVFHAQDISNSIYCPGQFANRLWKAQQLLFFFGFGFRFVSRIMIVCEIEYCVIDVQLSSLLSPHTRKTRKEAEGKQNLFLLRVSWPENYTGNLPSLRVVGENVEICYAGREAFRKNSCICK